MSLGLAHTSGVPTGSGRVPRAASLTPCYPPRDPPGTNYDPFLFSYARDRRSPCMVLLSRCTGVASYTQYNTTATPVQRTAAPYTT
eukprot:1342306-Rhodomonas_salina.1